MKDIWPARLTFSISPWQTAVYLLYFVFIIVACITFVSIAHAYTSNDSETINLQIIVNEDQSMSGKLDITFATSPKDGTALYIVLPFKVGKIYKKDDIVVDTRDEYDYTIMYMTTSMNTKIKSEIAFQIETSPTIEPQQNSDLNQGPNILEIEQRGILYYTFHLRFDVQLSHRPFKNLTPYLNSMTKPSHIYVTFPEDTNYTYSPIDMTCDISTGPPNSWNKTGNTFMTTSAFYQDRHLCINYILPPPPSKSPPPSYNELFTTIAFALCSVGIVILSTPLEMLSKENRILIAAILNFIVIPLFIIFDILRGGLPFFLSSFPSILNSNLQGIIFYLTALTVLFSNMSFIKQIFKHIKNIFKRFGRRQAPAEASGSNEPGGLVS